MSAEILERLVFATLAMSGAIAVVMMLRYPLRAIFGAQVAYAFWLLVPVAMLASFLPGRVVLERAPLTETPVTPALDLATNTTASQMAPHVVTINADMVESVMSLPWSNLLPMLIMLWAFGIVISLGLVAIKQQSFLSNIGLKRLENGVHQAGASDVGPAVIGVWKPRIVVPADFTTRYSDDERALVIAHENAHIRAGDVQINAIAALIQALNWFNPLAYIARAALRIDQELACDARVMATHAGAKRIYAEAMLKTQLAARALPVGCYWPNIGAKPLKQRIAMLAQPAPSAQRRDIGAVACAFTALAVGLVAWVAQPPRSAYAETNTVSRALAVQLIVAIRDGEMDEARDLIAAGANVDQVVPGDGSPLIAAARANELELASDLMTRGADVNRAVLGDGNPLIAASAEGNVDMMRLFVRGGADVNAIVRGDETPLINAAREGKLEAVDYLINHGADVNLAVDAPTYNHGIERRSPLSMARRGGHADVVRLLERHGART